MLCFHLTPERFGGARRLQTRTHHGFKKTMSPRSGWRQACFGTLACAPLRTGCGDVPPLRSLLGAREHRTGCPSYGDERAVSPGDDGRLQGVPRTAGELQLRGAPYSAEWRRQGRNREKEPEVAAGPAETRRGIEWDGAFVPFVRGDGSVSDRKRRGGRRTGGADDGRTVAPRSGRK